MTGPSVVRAQPLVGALALLGILLSICIAMVAYIGHVAVRTGSGPAWAAFLFCAALLVACVVHLARRSGPWLLEDLLRLRLQAFCRQTGADLVADPRAGTWSLHLPEGTSAHRRAEIYARGDEIDRALRAYRRLVPAALRAKRFRVSAEALREID